MDINRFTQKAQEAIFQSQQLAQDSHHQTIVPVHLLLSLLHQYEGVFPAIVTKALGNMQGLLAEI